VTDDAATCDDGRWRLAPASFVVRVVDETGSTNADLLAEARAGAPAGLVLVARYQSAGRGRHGRTWTAPPGSALLCSILLRPHLPAAELHRCTQAVAVAAARACESVAGVRPSVKWPNDLLVEGRKLAGVLAESVLGADGAVEAVVVGIGCNVTAAALPAEVAATATSLEAASGGVAVEPARLLDALLGSLASLDLDEVAVEYRQRLATLGTRVRVERPAGDLVGTAVDVRSSGVLVVRDDAGREHDVVAGDVTHLRPAGPGSPDGRGTAR
jgi:BirA family biotin operon repressor/biotin-[acetyl-CoA-carboxylase] ligase